MNRDNQQLFQVCTDEFKKVDNILVDKQGLLHSAFVTVNDFGISMEKLSMQLLSVFEDIDSNVQSVIEACPRLSLLSYDKLTDLIKAWLVSPVDNLPFGNPLLIYICNFHVLSYLLLIYICKLHWNLNTMFVCQVNHFLFTYEISMS